MSQLTTCMEGAAAGAAMEQGLRNRQFQGIFLTPGSAECAANLFRDAAYELVMLAMWEDPADVDQNIA